MKNMIGSVRMALWLCRRAPWLMRVLFTAVVYWVRQKRDLFFWKSVPYVDQTTLSLPFVSDIWVESITEAFHFGAAGPVLDLGLYDQPWGFDPEEINFPIQIWHGEMDRNVPLIIAKRLADRIPNCRATFIPDEGHFSLWLNYIEDIMKTMISQSIRTPIIK
jgi:pimeloyl-ACP methyl ester carboxylesterase